MTSPDAPSRSVSHLTSAAAEAWCVEQLAFPVSSLGPLGRNLPFWIRLEYRVRNDVGAERRRGRLDPAGPHRCLEPAAQDGRRVARDRGRAFPSPGVNRAPPSPDRRLSRRHGPAVRGDDVDQHVAARQQPRLCHDRRARSPVTNARSDGAAAVSTRARGAEAGCPDGPDHAHDVRSRQSPATGPRPCARSGTAARRSGLPCQARAATTWTTCGGPQAAVPARPASKPSVATCAASGWSSCRPSCGETRALVESMEGRDLRRGFTLTLLLLLGAAWLVSLAPLLFIAHRISQPDSAAHRGAHRVCRGRLVATRRHRPRAGDRRARRGRLSRSTRSTAWPISCARIASGSSISRRWRAGNRSRARPRTS